MGQRKTTEMHEKIDLEEDYQTACVCCCIYSCIQIDWLLVVCELWLFKGDKQGKLRIQGSR